MQQLVSVSWNDHFAWTVWQLHRCLALRGLFHLHGRACGNKREHFSPLVGFASLGSA